MPDLVARVSITETEIFQDFMVIVKDILDDENIPEDIRTSYVQRIQELCNNHEFQL